MRKGYLRGLTFVILFNVVIGIPVLGVVPNTTSYKDISEVEQVPVQNQEVSGVAFPEERKAVKIDKNIQTINQKESKEETIERLNKIVSDSMLNMTINSNPVFEKGSGNLNIENKLNNNNIEVEIHLKESGLLVYKSKKIEVDGSIEQDNLDIFLEKGDYPALAIFRSIEIDTNKILGEGKLEILLTIV